MVLAVLYKLTKSLMATWLSVWMQDQTTIVDFGMIIGQVSLGDSSMGAGSSIALVTPGSQGRTTVDDRTVLMAATALGGGIGPVDIIDGQDGGMNINAHFQLKVQWNSHSLLPRWASSCITAVV